MESSSQVVKIINEAVDSSVSEGVYTSKSGIKFKLKPVSNLLIVDATSKLKKPKPPVIYIEDKGRKEENPSDPLYNEAMQTYNADRATITMGMVIGFGCEVEYIPEGFFQLESDEWVDDLVYFGVDVPQKGRARKVCWIRYHLIPSDEEQTKLMIAIMRNSGQTVEADVDEALSSFRSNEGRSTA